MGKDIQDILATLPSVEEVARIVLVQINVHRMRYRLVLASTIKAADVAARLRMRLRSLLHHQPHPPPTARKVKPQGSSGRAGGLPILIMQKDGTRPNCHCRGSSVKKGWG